MNSNIIVWPTLELTEQERQYVGHYATPEKPGVLNRVYSATLIASSNPSVQSQPTQQITFSGRRVRVYAATFSGDIAGWSITVSNPAGTLFTTQQASVASLTGYQEDLTGPPTIPQYNTALGSPQPYLSNNGPEPLIFEPNIIIEGTDSLIFEGTVGQQWLNYAGGQIYTAVLNIALHCWEFPAFPRERPILNKQGRTQNQLVKGVR